MRAKIDSMTCLLTALTILIVDQLSKAAALALPDRRVVGRSRFWSPFWPRIRPTENPRPARWLGRRRWVLLLVWSIAVGGTLALALRHPTLGSPIARAGLGAAIGGATGNLIDLLRRGAVVDFIDLRWWPVFNLADVAIVAGALTAGWSVVQRTLW